MCIQNPDISYQGNYINTAGYHLIALSFTFTCNGRVTGVTAHLTSVEPFDQTPGTQSIVFQVWHPVLPGSSVYSIVGQVHFQSAVQITERIYISTVLLTEDDQIEFHSGDVIASYQPPNPSHFIQYILDANHTSYRITNTNLTTATIDISGDGTVFDSNFHPMFNITTGKYSFIHAMVIPNLVLYIWNELICIGFSDCTHFLKRILTNLHMQLYTYVHNYSKYIIIYH